MSRVFVRIMFSAVFLIVVEIIKLYLILPVNKINQTHHTFHHDMYTGFKKMADKCNVKLHSMPSGVQSKHARLNYIYIYIYIHIVLEFNFIYIYIFVCIYIIKPYYSFVFLGAGSDHNFIPLVGWWSWQHVSQLVFVQTTVY